MSDDKKTILLVDDNPSIRNVVKMTLEFKGYKIQEAEDGQEAYEFLKVNSVDLILTDLAMPGLSGLELLDKVRQELNLSDVPFILFTAEAFFDPEDIHARGANYIFRKPVSPIELLETVEKLI